MMDTYVLSLRPNTGQSAVLGVYSTASDLEQALASFKMDHPYLAANWYFYEVKVLGGVPEWTNEQMAVK